MYLIQIRIFGGIMKTKKFLKKSISIIICLSIAVSALCLIPSVSAKEEYQGENLDVPQIRITTENGNGLTLQKTDGYVNAQIEIKDTDESVLADAVSFKVRGNTTAITWVTKKAFTFKFAKKKNVLGLGSGKKWALLANAFDPTLLRNYSAFELARELGMEFTSNQKFVELWVDGSFRGCYILYEPVEEGKDRVNIDIESNDGKKDFMLELEQVAQEEDKTYLTIDKKKIRFAFSEPEEPDEEQVAYVQAIMDDILATIKTGTQEEIEQKIDVDSFAKYFLLNEFLKTNDFDRTSVYFYYKDGKLDAGPAWDYDLCTGNENADFSARSKDAAVTSGVYANKNIFVYLAKYSWFNDMVTELYGEHYDYFANLYADGGFFDSAYEQYQPVIERNYNEAGWIITKWWVNHIKKPLPTYDENYDFMKNWCAERNAWMTIHYDPFEAGYKIGDLNGDGETDVLDATIVQKAASEKAALNDVENILADVNDDNNVDVLDATDIQLFSVDKVESFKRKV